MALLAASVEEMDSELAMGLVGTRKTHVHKITLGIVTALLVVSFFFGFEAVSSQRGRRERVRDFQAGDLSEGGVPANPVETAEVEILATPVGSEIPDVTAFQVTKSTDYRPQSINFDRARFSETAGEQAADLEDSQPESEDSAGSEETDLREALEAVYALNLRKTVENEVVQSEYSSGSEEESLAKALEAVHALNLKNKIVSAESDESEHIIDSVEKALPEALEAMYALNLKKKTVSTELGESEHIIDPVEKTLPEALEAMYALNMKKKPVSAELGESAHLIDSVEKGLPEALEAMYALSLKK